MSSDQHLQMRSAEMRKVTLVGAVTNLFLTVFQVIVGILAHSQALVADAIHTLSDLVSDAVVLLAVRHASEEPDEEHPYGHGRFETAATLVLGLMLLLVGAAISWRSGARLFSSEPFVTPGLAALYVSGLTILAKEGMYWYTMAVARRTRSKMLRANAWHHRSDALSSLVVFVGIGGAIAGLGYLDAVAAAIVGVMIAKMGVELIWGAMSELLDAGLEAQTLQQLRDAIKGVYGVRSLHGLRTRRQGHEAMADIHVQVAPRLSVSEGHMISLAVEQQIKGAVPEITDVVVHIDPEDDEEGPSCEGLPLRDQTLRELRRLWQGLDPLDQTGKVTLHYLAGRINVELFLPLDGYQGAEAAETLQRQLQERIAADPRFGRVEIHFTTQRDRTKKVP